MIRIERGEFNSNSRKFTAHVEIDANDGDERSNQLFDIFEKIFEEIINGPRIEFPLDGSPVIYQKE